MLCGDGKRFFLQASSFLSVAAGFETGQMWRADCIRPSHKENDSEPEPKQFPLVLEKPRPQISGIWILIMSLIVPFCILHSDSYLPPPNRVMASFNGRADSFHRPFSCPGLHHVQIQGSLVKGPDPSMAPSVGVALTQVVHSYIISPI